VVGERPASHTKHDPEKLSDSAAVSATTEANAPVLRSCSIKAARAKASSLRTATVMELERVLGDFTPH
jgi:hypothetical protein